ncbi:MAG TPA: lysylphosphatidylglycerol synthase transmembrane domain-containing protein [Taishania sp.]|nr:lysylphosphatidylglycerol synthase transmembrane domain-containing protein [Taishania sp.]
MLRKTILTIIKTVLPLAIGIYLFWLFFSSMSEEHIASFKKAIRETNYWWIFLACVLEFVSLWSRAMRWKYMLEPMGYTSPWKNRYHALMIGYLANYTLPRAGEPTRAAMLYRSDGIPFAKSFGTIIAERAVDVIMLSSIMGITMLIGYEDLSAILTEVETQLGGEKPTDSAFGIKQIIYIIVGLLAITSIILYTISISFRAKLNDFVTGILNGLFAVFKTKNPVAFILHTLLIWSCWILMFIIPFFALKETSNISMTGMLIGFIVGSIGMSVTNGGIGVYPLIVGLVVAFYLKDDYPENARGIGNALGMIIWISNTLLMILLGLISLALLPNNFSKHDDKTREFTK